MARAYQPQEMSDPAAEPQAGEWQALRGELVALLDQVEGRYAQHEPAEPEPLLKQPWDLLPLHRGLRTPFRSPHHQRELAPVAERDDGAVLTDRRGEQTRDEG